MGAQAEAGARHLPIPTGAAHGGGGQGGTQGSWGPGGATEPRPLRQKPPCVAKARVQQCGLETRAWESTVHPHPGL